MVPPWDRGPFGEPMSARGRLARLLAASRPALSVVPSATPRTSPAPADRFREPARPARTVDLAEARATLDAGRFSTEYQAIVDARTGKTVAYEALGRFKRKDGHAIPPAHMFAVMHGDPALLLRAELSLKLHQLEHAPRAPLFVNLDPDSWARAGDRASNPFLGLFASAGRSVVVEVTEALGSTDAVRTQEMIAALQGRRLRVALDDVGSVNGVLSFECIIEADVLKFDRTLIPRMRHVRSRALVQAFTRMARETGANTVLEGVESTADFVLARDLGFDLVQGFLFQDRARVSRRW